MKHSPILVTGAPRSGTSLVAMTIAGCGFWTGKLRKEDKHNKRGYFENDQLTGHAFNNTYTGLGDITPDSKDIKHQPLERVWEFMSAEHGYKNQPWLWKEPAFCFLWPVMVEWFPNARWVLVYRDRDQIKRSMMEFYSVHTQYHDSIDDFIQRFEDGMDALKSYLMGEFAVVTVQDMVRGHFEPLEGLMDDRHQIRCSFRKCYDRELWNK